MQIFYSQIVKETKAKQDQHLASEQESIKEQIQKIKEEIEKAAKKGETSIRLFLFVDSIILKSTLKAFENSDFKIVVRGGKSKECNRYVSVIISWGDGHEQR